MQQLQSIMGSHPVEKINIPFCQQAFISAFISFIVANNISTQVIDSPEFHFMLLTLHNDVVILHHTTVRGIIIMAWDHYFYEMQMEMKTASGKISVTMDI
ncbi:hypothetical protein M422DRAFT_267215 [Sphaerobolus stellatus SS14]|uniref:Uncharacterized protein n=1 Tax=Sphaerobolus stellatus (strain SS14) TaxID=990650 RepID=A0A0C9UQ22_SPHS4|nr:hypothetical protein M422DRAFT_267215 [Sphaerobolus stellatus SS14]